METLTPSPEILLRWTAPIAPLHERSHQWYVRGGALVLAGAVYGIVTSNWTFTVVILLLAAVYFLERNMPVSLQTIEIATDGFRQPSGFTPWSHCKDFWLIPTPHYTELHIALQGALFNRTVIFQTGDTDPHLIRQVMSHFLPERPNQREKILDVFIRLCKL